MSKVPFNFKYIAKESLSHSHIFLNRWLPNGKTIGNEYVVINPKRHDSKPGSFKINFRTGKWADFATGDKGGDLISLYSYLFDCSPSDAALNIIILMGGGGNGR